jgi:flagellar biosynthesis/type III secretory pathway M-ring protein FliF/YscJ
VRFVQSIIDGISRGFGALQTGGKLLLVALGALVLCSLALLDFDTGSRETMVPLGIGSASSDIRVETASFLEGSAIPFEERGDDLYVPADVRLSVLGQLNEEKIVGADEINFNSLVDLGSNPLISQEHHRQMLLVAKMNAVKGMLAVRRDVGYVDIIIDEKAGLPGIGQSRIPPVAIVAIQMRGEPMTQEFADAVGHMVAGAQAGLKLQDVTVLDLTSMRHFKPHSVEAGAAGGYLEQQRRIEEHYRSRLEQFLAHIPGAVVTVTAVVRNQRQTIRETKIDDPKIAPISSETRESRSDAARPRYEEQTTPGSNIAASIDLPDEPDSETLTRDERESRFGGTETVIEDNTGYALQVNTVVGIPRSFLLKLFQDAQQNGTVADSSDPSLFTDFADRQTVELESALAPLIRTDPLDGAVAGQINVVMLPDFAGTLARDVATPRPQQSPPAVASTGGGFQLERNGLLLSVAAFGLIALGLLLRSASLRGGEPVAARAGGFGAAPLQSASRQSVPRHPDDALSNASALLEQIHELIDSNTDHAAAVIDQWMSSNGRPTT